MVACHTRSAKTAVMPRPGGSAERGERTARPVGRRGGALVSGSAVASRGQGVAGDLEGATGEVPGKEEGAGAHQSSGSTARRRKRRRAAVFNGGGVAPVVVDEGGWSYSSRETQG
jgi:hypothetical protein